MGVLRVWNGTGWDEIKGERGDDGASAYQIAVADGFVGTEQEWLDSLAADPIDPVEIENAVATAIDAEPRVSGLVSDMDIAKPAALMAKSRVVDVRDYAASIADLAIDAGPAIIAAYADLMSAGGGTLLFGQADYLVGITGIQMAPTAPMTIDLNGQTLRTVRSGPSETYGWRIEAEVSPTTLVSSANIGRSATTVTLVDASTVSAGDILRFTGNDIVETGWNTRRYAAMLVEKVVGNVVHFTSRFRIPFPTSDCFITHYKQPKNVTVKNGTFHYDELPYNMAEPEMIAFLGLHRPKVENVNFTSDQEYMPGGQNYGCGVRIVSCVGATLSDVQFEGIHYGAVVTLGSLNTYAQNIRATKTRHAIAPTGWAVNTVTNGITGDLNWQTIESHPAFETHYSNVYLTREEAYPNLRCVGGSISNGVIHCDATDASSRPLMHNVELGGAGSLSWYDDAVLSLQNVQIITPNMTNATAIGARYGNVVLDNVIANVRRDNADRDAFEYLLKSITIKNCRNTDGTPWARRVVAAQVANVADQPVLHATFDGTVHHIDPYQQAVYASNDMMRCYGKIRQGVQAAGTLTIPLRIHTNAWSVPADGYPTPLHGVLRLRATVRHGNAGTFDILTKEFHFYHSAASAGTVIFPDTPAYTDAPTGQTSESLAMTIANPTQTGRSAGLDTWVQVDVSLSSGRTNPVYGLTYDLELVKGV